MIGFFDVAIPLDHEKLVAEGQVPKLEPNTTIEDRARELIANFDRDGDGKLKKEELPKQFQLAFGMLDTNSDEAIDTAEATTFIKMRGGQDEAAVASSAIARGATRTRSSASAKAKSARARLTKKKQPTLRLTKTTRPTRPTPNKRLPAAAGAARDT